tara:strand:- start:52 stop:714 length:663 start_codon:yes stop_codon:yes gene_type:complete
MIGNNLDKIRRELPEHVELVAVSKTKPLEDIQEAFDAGQRIFGENKVQEMTAKWEALPKEIEWHFIGHLQRNKVKYLAPFVSLIHGVESFRLLKEINKQALKSNRIIDVLLQIYIADEETKFGLTKEEANDLLSSDEFKLLKNIQVRGVMGMATFTKDQKKIKGEFHELKKIYSSLKEIHFLNNDYFNIISMGMSGDYLIAIDEGSTMIRIGSSIFGARN